MADGSIVEYNLVRSIEVKFKNRRRSCNAMVLNGKNEPLLGAIALEVMDILIHPLKQKFVVNPENHYLAE